MVAPAALYTNPKGGNEHSMYLRSVPIDGGESMDLRSVSIDGEESVASATTPGTLNGFHLE